MHALGILRAVQSLRSRSIVGIADPALVANTACDLIDMGRLWIVAQIEPPVPDITLAEPENDLPIALVNTHRQIAIAK